MYTLIHFSTLVLFFFTLQPIIAEEQQNLSPTASVPKMDSLLRLANEHQISGDYTATLDTLQQALTLSRHASAPDQQAYILSLLGDIANNLHDYEQATAYIDEGLELVKSLSRPALNAHLLNNQGNGFYMQENYAHALVAYQNAEKQLQPQNTSILHVRILTNQLRTYLKLNDLQTGLTALKEVQAHVGRLPETEEKTLQLISLGELTYLFLNKMPELKAELIDINYHFLSKALQLAEKFKNQKLIAQAQGLLGRLYYEQKRYSEATHLTREAIFLSQDKLDLLYRWEWQQGQIFQAQRNLTAATKAYQRSLSGLKRIRADLTKGYKDTASLFYEQIRPVYFSLADVLLQQAALSKSSAQKTDMLKQARNTIEQLKIAELQDYFQDECVSSVKTKITLLDDLDKKTAVLYPILLPDRTELLVSLPDGIHQVVIEVPAALLNQTALSFRENLQMGGEWQFATQAKQLYQWLIEPISGQLAAYHINTLVVVPDATLRTIPFSALVDVKTKRFLIQDFALVMTPGLNLTDPRPLPRTQLKILLSGLSEGVQNFSPLPHVPQEIEQIKSLFTKNDVLLDKTFLIRNFDKNLHAKPYSIIHIASHGQFDRNPKKTFLLTHDGKLTMDKLENLLQKSQIREEAVELLTLSACQTAVGDERAALGLAGIAIKAGVRSALASLWFVNDESTSLLIREFYRQLQNPSLSKAQALQNAQKELITQGYQHPLYWAPFLLIGNWL